MAALGTFPTPVVIDDGSDTCKAGYAGNAAPCAVFPSVVGKPPVDPTKVGAHLKDCYVGDQAIQKKPIIQLRDPVDPNVRSDWDDQEKIWHHVFYNELRIRPEDHPVLITEVPLDHQSDKQRTATVLFEQFKVPSLCLEPRPLLALFATGSVTGTVLDSGHKETYAACALDGSLIEQTVQTLHLGGLHITKLLQQRLQQLGLTADLTLARDIKEKCCFVNKKSQPTDTTLTTKVESFQLPDGTDLQLGNEIFECPNSLFETDSTKETGFHNLVHQSIKNTESELQAHFSSNICLSGGNTMLLGMADRLRDELFSLTSKHSQVTGFPDRKYLSWIGGSILSSLSTFPEISISKSEYLEFGPSVVERKKRLLQTQESN